MRTISADEASQQLSQLLEEVTTGEEVVITEHGSPVAKLVPMVESASAAEKRQRVEALIEHLRKGALRGGRLLDWTRDELYGRDAARRETLGWDASNARYQHPDLCAARR